MISRREDYRYLLDELSNIVYNYHYKYGVLVDQNDEPVSDDIKAKNAFYIVYSNAYRKCDDPSVETTVSEDYEPFFILKSYEMFNYLINTMIGEYSIYSDVGTGKVLYYPYQPVADILFNADDDYSNKEILMEYLKTVLPNVFNDTKVRVKK